MLAQQGLLSHLRRALVDLLFPARCAGCGVRGAWLCTACSLAIPRPARPLCPRCGMPLRRAACSACSSRPWALHALRVAVEFAPPVRTLVHRLKFRRAPFLAEPLSDLLLEAQREFGAGDLLLAPVPLHADRERQRGYNQAALLAGALGARTGLPCTAVIARVRATPPQVGLSLQERWQNVAGAFAVTAQVGGARVLLVDDVATTGATLNAAATALRAAGAAWVGGIAVARPGIADGASASGPAWGGRAGVRR